MVKYNREKLEELILYIAARYEGDSNFGTTRLTKVLFWSDFEHFRETGEAIAGGTYIKLQQGPMLNGLQDFLKGMEGHGLLRVEERPSQGAHPLQRPVALREPNTQLFTPEELALIDRIIAEHWGETATDVSDFSHEFLGWQAARWREPIPYGTVWLSAPTLTPEEVQRGLELAARLGRT